LDFRPTNDLLRALLTPEYQRLSAKLEQVNLKVGEVVYRADHFGSPLQRLLLRYTQVLLAVISQSVACSRCPSASPAGC